MVDPLIKPRELHVSVGALRPLLPDIFEQAPIIPLPDLRPEALRSDLSHGEHHVSVGVQLLTLRPLVDRHVCNHATSDKLLFDERVNKRLLLLVVQVGGEGDVHLSCKLGIDALLSGLHVVPELLPILHPLRGSTRGQDVALSHLLLAGVVVLFVIA